MSIINTGNFLNSGRPYPISPKGDKIDMKISDDRHYGINAESKSIDDVSESFAEVLNTTLGNVNDLQVHADDLTQKMVANPNSVDVHEVMIASEKARIALTFTKTMVDGVIRAYRELTNLR